MSIEQALFFLDGERRISSWSGEAERLSGFTPEDVLGRDVATIFPRLDRPLDAVPREASLARADGTSRPVQVSAVRAPHEPTTCVVVLPLTDDWHVARQHGGQAAILERIATGAPLTGTLDAIVRLVEAHIPDALGSLLLLDADGLHLHCASCKSLPDSYNAAIEGVAIGPNVGSCGTAAFRREPVFVDDIATDELWRDFLAAALGHGLRACWSTPILSRRGASASQVLGTFAVYFRTPRAAARHHRDMLAQAEYLACIAIDADRAASQLHATEARFRAFVDHATDAFFVHELTEGRIVDVNLQTCEALGYAREELIGALPSLYDPDTTAEQLGESMRRVRGARPVTFVARHRRKDGSTFPVEVRMNRFEVGGERYALALARDVTQRSALEAQLRQAQKMEAVGRLAGGVAHDFNNLLTVINGFSDMLLGDLPAEVPWRGDLQSIRDAGGRAAGLTAQLLAFSRRTIIEPRRLSPSALVLRLAQMLERVIGEDIELVLHLDAMGSVLADPAQLEQVLVNLVVNARDAMPLGGTLVIETSDVPSEPGRPALTRLVVSDTGEGMSDEVKARVFEPFFTTKPQGKGTGLGLATVYAIVEQAGGTIELETALGCGARFTVLFPTLSGEEAEAVAEIEGAPGGHETILLVEDEEGVRLLAKRALDRYGYEVLVASSGEEAARIERAHAGNLHLLITDVVMPGVGGRTVADRIRQLRPRTRVLYVSGYTDDEIVRHGVFQSQDAFLQKPFTPLALAKKVRAVLDGDDQAPSVRSGAPGPRLG